MIAATPPPLRRRLPLLRAPLRVLLMFYSAYITLHVFYGRLSPRAAAAATPLMLMLD